MCNAEGPACALLAARPLAWSVQQMRLIWSSFPLRPLSFCLFLPWGRPDHVSLSAFGH